MIFIPSAPVCVLLSSPRSLEVKCYPCTNTEPGTPSFRTGGSGGLNLHFSTFLQRRKGNKPQNNLQNACVRRSSEDLPGSFRQRAAKAALLGNIRAQLMMYGRGVRGAAALAGVDWQGEPTSRRDGSLFPISQATALSQDREPSIFSSGERKTGQKKWKLWKAWDPGQRRKLFSLLLPNISLLLLQVLQICPYTDMFTPQN